jgi:hypothetical protein
LVTLIQSAFFIAPRDRFCENNLTPGANDRNGDGYNCGPKRQRTVIERRG